MYSDTELLDFLQSRSNKDVRHVIAKKIDEWLNQEAESLVFEKTGGSDICRLFCFDGCLTLRHFENLKKVFHEAFASYYTGKTGVVHVRHYKIILRPHWFTFIVDAKTEIDINYDYAEELREGISNLDNLEYICIPCLAINLKTF